MVKRAAKKKTARKKSAKKSSKKGPVNVPEIREQVRHLIAEQIEPMVTANTEEATKGHLSQLKYLFEVLGVYPEPAAEAETEPEDSNDLAKVLLNRLDFPHREPVEEEQDETAVPDGDGERFGRMIAGLSLRCRVSGRGCGVLSLGLRSAI